MLLQHADAFLCVATMSSVSKQYQVMSTSLSSQGHEPMLLHTYMFISQSCHPWSNIFSDTHPHSISLYQHYLVAIFLCQELLNIINHFVWICFRAISLHRISLMIYQELGKVPPAKGQKNDLVYNGIQRYMRCNLKTYLMSFVPSSEGSFSFKKEYTSRVFLPFTWPFSNQTNLSFAANFVSTKSNISA